MSNFSLKFRGCSNTQNTPYSYGLAQDTILAASARKPSLEVAPAALATFPPAIVTFDLRNQRAWPTPPPEAEGVLCLSDSQRFLQFCTLCSRLHAFWPPDRQKKGVMTAPESSAR